MQIQTLEELREKNRLEEESQEQETEIVEEAEAVDEVEHEETDEDETQTDETSEESETVLDEQPAWMDAGESDDEESVNEVAAKVRRKWKGKFEEAHQEADTLRSENDALKAQLAQMSGTQNQVKEQPKLEDFDYDEAKFQAAHSEWVIEQAEARVIAREKQNSLAAQQAERQQRLKQSLDNHYNEADGLVNSGQISADKYESAEEAVRNSISKVAGQDESTVDLMIDAIGEGSAKVVAHLGINAKRRNEFISLLQTDPVKVTLWLGELKAMLKAPAKKISKAAKPSPKLKGESSSSGESALKAKYKNAKTAQERFKISQQGRAAGFKTVNW